MFFSPNQKPRKGQHFRLTCPASGGNVQTSELAWLGKMCCDMFICCLWQIRATARRSTCDTITPPCCLVDARQDTSSFTPASPGDSTGIWLQLPWLLLPKQSHWTMSEGHPSSLWSREIAIEPIRGHLWRLSISCGLSGGDGPVPWRCIEHPQFLTPQRGCASSSRRVVHVHSCLQVTHTLSKPRPEEQMVPAGWDLGRLNDHHVSIYNSIL